MSREIDERVVQMKFENGQFEHNVQTSIHSLDELKKGLDFKDASKGLEKIDKASKEIKMDPLTASVELLNSKFNLLGITAFNVMNRISNKAIETGEALIRSLTLDQVSAGWGKYADKTSAVQTIMSATAKQFTDTGEQMDYVNKQLDKLNWFTDETSYNFLEMVNNIGKFTSNNIALDTSVTAMQGIANWAAISGANANEASRAMYNLSQAISTGALKLQDWMSIENANMATAQFKETAIEAAVSAGTLKRGADGLARTFKGDIVSVENFRENLSEAWLTSKVLLDTLELYGGATNRLNEVYEEFDILTSDIVSGIDDYTAGIRTAKEIADDWDISLENTIEILHDFSTETMQFGLKAFKAAQEAKTFEDVINSVKDAVSTGWMNTFEMFFGDYQQAKTFWTDLANIMYGVFAESGNARNDMLKKWSEMGGRSTFIDALYNSISALLSIMAPLKAAWNDIFPEMDANRFLSITTAFRDFTQSLILSEESMDKVRRTAKGFFAILDIIGTALNSLVYVVFDVIRYISPFTDGMFSATASLGDFLEMVDQAVKESNIFGKVFGGIAEVIKTGVDVIRSATQILSGFIAGMFSNTDGDKIKNSIYDIFVNSFGKAGNVIASFLNILRNVKNMILSMTPDFESIRVATSKFFEVFKNPFSELNFEHALNVVNASLFGAFLLGLKKFTSKLISVTENVTGVFKNIKNLFGDLSESLNAFTGSLKSDILLKVSASIAILVGSLVLLAAIDTQQLANGLAAITALFAELFAMMTGVDKLISAPGFKKMISLATLFTTISISVLVLAAAIRVLASLEWNEIVNGLTAVGALCAELVASAKLLSSQSKSMIKGAAGLIAFAISIRLLVGAVKSLSQMDTETLIVGLIGVGAIMAEVLAFVKLSSGSGMKLGSGVGLIALAAALKVLASVVSSFGGMELETMKRGLLGVGAVLTELIAFSYLMNNAKHILSTALAMNLLGSALLILSSAIKSFGSIPVDQMRVGLIGLGGALAEITLALNLMPKNVISKGVALIAVSSSIVILANALGTLGGMQPSVIAKGLIALAGSLTIIAVALRVMKGSVSGIAAISLTAAALFILAPAIRLLGTMSLANIASALLALAGTFTIFGVAATALTPMAPMLFTLSASLLSFGAATLAIGAGISLLSAGLLTLGAASSVGLAALTSVISGVLDLIPLFFEQVAVGITQFATILSEHAPVLMDSLTVLMMSFLQVIVNVTPAAIDAVLTLLSALLESLRTHVPDMVTSAMFLLKGFIEGISLNIGDVVGAAIDLVLKFIGGIVSKLDDVVNTGFDVIIAFMDGLGTAVNERGPELIEAFFRLAGNIIAGLAKGLWAGVKDVVGAIISVGEAMLKGIKDFFGIKSPSKEMEKIGKYIIEGLINGIKDTAKEAIKAIQDVGNKLINSFNGLLGINSPSVVMAESGKWIVRGIAEGIKKDMSAEEAIKKKAENIQKAFESALEPSTLLNKSKNLDYELWTLTEGKNATDTQKQAMLMGTYEADLALLAEKVKNKQAEMKALGKLWGQQSTEYLKAENEWKESKIEMLTKANEIDSLQKFTMNDEREQMRLYAQTMKEYAETFKMLGKSDEELMAFAKEKSGYGIQKADATIIDTVSIVNDALADVDVSIEQAVASTVANAVTKGTKAAAPALEKAGGDASKGFADGVNKDAPSIEQSASNTVMKYLSFLTDGLDEHSPSKKTLQIGEYAIEGFVNGLNNNASLTEVQNSATKIVKIILDTFQASIQQYEYIARMSMQGFINGINQAGQQAIAAAQAIAARVAAIMRSTLRINSPSKVTQEIGQGVGEGLAMGILDNAPMVDKSSDELANNALLGLDHIKSQISNILAQDDNYSPTITPVLDLDTVKEQASTIPGLFSNGTNLHVRTSLNRANSIASTRNVPSQNGSAVGVGDTNYNFTQNNYSPKALNRVEIYRQTQNQFSQLKGATRK